ncbi:DUF1800 domain-containing protein [Rufibacter ruber]|uniref:DUF1800 domain-containing protein n=1 Tax=Rufibacter ruber TaxID=1783499 RepID=UPI000837A8FE|nr:DUF1800 domain-containing protein [Rufibacter ruber]
MKKTIQLSFLVTLLLVAGLFFSSFGEKHTLAAQKPKFPYKKAGLTERQAAAHLLSRFTYGPKPGQVDEVVQLGLEKWFLQQLTAELPDQDLSKRLAEFPTLKMTNQQMVQTFPQGGQLVRMAVKDGVIEQDKVKAGFADKDAKEEYRQKLGDYLKQKGYRPEGDLYKELISQKILRAIYTQNQLQEILTSFWFNHFNVSLTNKNCSPYILSYERDVIRPNALGQFEKLLLATAKSPAMLAYLDNFKSTVSAESLNPSQKKVEQLKLRALEERQAKDTSAQNMQMLEMVKQAQKKQGLNENYAREIMELHTLGVDGGYTQQDVTQAARVLTGWTINPAIDRYNVRGKNAYSPKRLEAMTKQGYVFENDFVFAANKHDKGRKVVLGKVFPANGGYEEGLELIKMLAHHPSTAKFISRKLAIRFVNDNPPQSLIDKMAKTFTEKKGDIQQVLLTMVASPEFWGKEALREKTKSPFELAISSVRSLNAEVKAPYQLYNWVSKMGERMYYYQAPTGFPDKGTYWINTGSLLNRMNFGLALASQRIPGVSIDLMALNQHREPESAEAALATYSSYLMPERDLQETIKRLTPSLNDPNFSRKVDAAANQHTSMASAGGQEEEEEENEAMMSTPRRGKVKSSGKNLGAGKALSPKALQANNGNNTMLAQVVGIIIGSPEFQRR